MGQILLQWKEPAAVRKKKLSLGFSIFRIVLIFAGIGFVLYDVFKRDYSGLFAFVFALGVGEAFNRIVPEYFVADEGIRYEDGHRPLQFQCRWENIEWYMVRPMDDMPGLEQVIFKVKNGKWWKAPPLFTYDPKKIDKAELLRILEERLPQKEFGHRWTKDNPFDDFAP